MISLRSSQRWHRFFRTATNTSTLRRYSNLRWHSCPVGTATGDDGPLRIHRRELPCALPLHSPHCCVSNSLGVFRKYHTSLVILSAPDSFHGISLPDDNGKLDSSSLKSTTSATLDFHHDDVVIDDNNSNNNNHEVQEAQVVKSEQEKEKTREMIAEIARAELMAHSIISSVGGGEKSKSNDDSNDDKVQTRDGEDYFLSMSPYERRVYLLKEEEQSHASQYDRFSSSQSSGAEEVMRYAQSCMNIGELQYQLGQMEQSEENFMDALKQLLGLYDDLDNEQERTRKEEVQFQIAQIMHSLGAIHARCEEYDEAYQWYQESVKRKRGIFGEVNANDNNGASDRVIAKSSSASVGYHFELGKTYNGLAALQIMHAGVNGPNWDKAMRLFREAERNYVYHYSNNNFNSSGATSIISLAKEVIQKMEPHHAQSLINVRSNMGELLLQQEDVEKALESFRTALDLVKLDVERMIEEEGTNNGNVYIPSIHEPGPDERRNAMVDLQLKIADCLAHNEDHDPAAEAYERALHYHIVFRRWNKNSESAKKFLTQSSELPVSMSNNNVVEADIDNATSLEAALRSSLAHSLAQIGQSTLSQKHYESSLAIKRRIGGDNHLEVAHTLMSLGALLGSTQDTSTALNCFKEALYIYRTNLEEASGVHDEKRGGEQLTFYDEDQESVLEIQGFVQNAMKNITLIESAILKSARSQR